MIARATPDPAMFTRRRIDKLREGRDVYGLIVALWHRRKAARRAAAVALGDLGDQRAVDPLIGALQEDGPRAVRLAAVRAVGDLRDERATRPLVALVEDDSEDREVRWAAAEALGEIGDPRAFEPLFASLRDE